MTRTTTRLLLTTMLAVTIGSGSFFVVSAEAGKAKFDKDSTKTKIAKVSGSKVSDPSGPSKPSDPSNSGPSRPSNSGPSASNSGPSASGKAPEIDPGMARAGLVILAGGLMMLVDRYRRR